MFLVADAVAQWLTCLLISLVVVCLSLLWQLKSQVKDIFHALDVLYINGTSNHMFIDPLALDGYIG